jgi:hypothetical protein
MKARISLVVSGSLLAMAIGLASAQQNPFLGKWNLSGTGADAAYTGWLEMTDNAGQLSGLFLNRGGAPNPLASAKVENGELVFQGAARGGGPGTEGRARVQGSAIVGAITNPATARPRADDSIHRPAPAAVSSVERQRAAHLRHANRAVRRKVIGRVHARESR